MLRRLVAILAACLALIATQSAWAVPMFCRAEAEHRVCHCHHDASMAPADDCCNRGTRDTLGAPGIALPVPSFVAIRLPTPDVPVLAAAPPDRTNPAAAYVAATPARGPPGTPRFLRLRSLMI